MNLNAFFKKLWQSRAEAEAQEQKIRDQEEQDRKDADKAKAREEAERRAAGAEAEEIEDSIRQEEQEDLARVRDVEEERERVLPPSQSEQQQQDLQFDPPPTYKDGIDMVFEEEPDLQEWGEQDATTPTADPEDRGQEEAPDERSVLEEVVSPEVVEEQATGDLSPDLGQVAGLAQEEDLEME